MKPEKESSWPDRSSLWLLVPFGILISALLTSKRAPVRKSALPKNSSNDGADDIVIIRSHVNEEGMPVAQSKYESCQCNQRTRVWEKIASIAQGTIALITVGLLIVSIYSARATKQALKATNAGVIHANIGLSNGSLNVVFENRGKGNATDVSGHFRIIWETIPEGNIIWTSEWKSVESKVTQVGEGPNNRTFIGALGISAMAG